MENQKYLKIEAIIKVASDETNLNYVNLDLHRISYNYVTGVIVKNGEVKNKKTGFSHPKNSQIIKFVKYFRDDFHLVYASQIVMRIVIDTINTLKIKNQVDGVTLSEIFEIVNNKVTMLLWGMIDEYHTL